MDNYQRMLVYINSYKNGVLYKNVGSAKIEIRNRVCRIVVVTKELLNKTMANVYLFRRNGLTMKTTYLGGLEAKSGKYELRIETSADNMLDTEKAFEEYSGFLIMKADQKNVKEGDLCAGIWDNESLGEEINADIHILQKETVPPQLDIEKRKEEEMSEKEMLSPKNSLREAIEEPKEKDLDQAIKDKCGEEQVDCMELRLERVNGIRNSFAQITLEDSDYEIENMLNDLLKRNPRLIPFGKEIECVRIEPEEIMKLPINIWMLVNNSFVQESYNKYKHLVLYYQNDSYIFGVPGIKSDKEKFMAYLHGFCEFREINCKNMDRCGYWIMQITKKNRIC